MVITPTVPMPHTTHLLISFKATLTDANPDYIGSLTLPAQLCRNYDLYGRQLVHIRVRGTGVELWTYIIVGEEQSVCMNGAAARLAKKGDEIMVSAFHHAGFVECAMGKIHRACVSRAADNGLLKIDRVWMRHAGIETGQVATVANIRNGKRDTVCLEEGGNGVCEVGVRGYEEGDLIIVVSYAWVKLDDLRKGDIPEMKICFPTNS